MKCVRHTHILGKEAAGRSKYNTAVYFRHYYDRLEGSDSYYYFEATLNVKMLAALGNLYSSLCVFSFLPALITLGIILDYMIDAGFIQTYKNMSVAFYLFIAFMAAGVVAFIIFYKLSKRKRFELMNYRDRSGAVLNRMINQSFTLPDNKMSIDYLQPSYVSTSGKIRKITALTVDIYYDDENLFILDNNLLLKIPKSEMRYSEAVEEKFKFVCNIAGNIDSKEYRDCGIRPADNLGRYGCKNYGVFIFDDGKETYEIQVLPTSYEKLRALFNR